LGEVLRVMWKDMEGLEDVQRSVEKSVIRL